MAGRLGRSWALARRHPVRVVGAVGVVAVLVVAAIAGGEDQRELSTRDAADTTTTTEEPEVSTTATSTSSTTTSSTTITAPATTSTAVPATTIAPPPPPPTTPPRQIFVVQSSPQGLAAMNADGSGLHLLVEGPFRTPDLAPNRSWLVLTRSTDLGFDLYTVNADGSGLTMIDGGHWFSPRVSPDGTKIAAIEIRPSAMYLVIMDRSGGGQREIHLPNGPTNNVDWSPDGKKLLVTSSSSSALSVYDLATGEQRLIRSGEAALPIWSPDGSHIAFLDGGDLVVIPAGGGADQVLTGTFAESPREMAWDGSAALLFTAGNRMYRIGRDGSGLVQVGIGMSSPAA